MSAHEASYASERDYVARFLLKELEKVAEHMGISDVVRFYVEKTINGTPDLTAEKGGKGLFIVEAKFKKKVGRIERDIEPRDPEVIRQALDYAGWGGFPYYATCNVKRLILFQRKPEAKALECEIASFEYERSPDWAERFLKIVLGLIPIQLKPLDDTLVDTLHEAYSDLYPEFLTALKNRLRDTRFKERYIEWLESQGVKLTEKTNRLIAEQTTYLQLNKLLFYQVIRAIYPNRLEPLKISEEEDESEALSRFFSEVREIDYEPIYQSDVISEIPFTSRAKERIRTLLDTLNEFDFSKMESDFIGHMYEKLIPPSERKRLGQFYTPPAIVDLIIELTVEKPDDIILDPGCGSGTFLVRGYRRLRELNHIPKDINDQLAEKFHQKILQQLYGVDINQFPAHLTVINLAIQNPKAKIERLNAIVKDVFAVKPGQVTLFGFKSITTEGKPTTIYKFPTFSVVVANPPYIRQELLGEKEKLKIKSLIESEYKGKVFIGVPSKKTKHSIILDKKSDIYIYFYIHGLKFLRDGGRLGFISSNKWLEVRYGESFQHFLLDTCKIVYIIEFDKSVFPDAEVNTEVTILEKLDGEKNNQNRNANTIKFIHINRALTNNYLLNRIKNEEKADDADLRILTVRQGDLRPGKWSIYLRAPSIYFKLIKNPKLKPFEQIAGIVRGYTTGYDPYFIIDKDKVKEWQIEKEYLEPCAPPGKAVKGFIIEPKHITQYFLTVHEKKERLQGTNVLHYLQYGEKLEAPPSKRRRESVNLTQVETIKNRQLWYELPDLPMPSIIFPMWFRYKYRPLLNNAKAYANDFYYYISVSEDDKEVLVALLHSTLTQFLLELAGRQYSGMLHMKVYELKRLPMLNLSILNNLTRKKLKDLFLKLNDAEVKQNEIRSKLTQLKGNKQELSIRKTKEELIAARKEGIVALSQIDKIIYDTLGLSEEEQITIAKELKRLREIRKLTTRGLRIKEEE